MMHVTQGDTMKIKGNNHWIDLDYDIPDWSDTDECEPCFTYKNWKYFLSEFLRPNTPWGDIVEGYDGQLADSMFSGILIKLSPDCEQVKAFTFYT